jgi:hypothetical protein
MQSIGSFAPLREIICATCSRYAQLTPAGIVLPAASAPYNPLTVTLVSYTPARTRYVNRKPLCRSLNGIYSVKDNIHCAGCDYHRTCTPQISLQCLYRAVPLRLLLAFTSAKNFISFVRTSHVPAGTTIEGVNVEISVLDRGKWGEAQFNLIR